MKDRGVKEIHEQQKPRVAGAQVEEVDEVSKT